MELHIAAASGNVHEMEALIARRPQQLHAVDYEGRTPLHVAAANGNAKAVQLLLNAGADPTARTMFAKLTPLDLCSPSEPGVKKVLLDASARPKAKSPSRSSGELRNRRGARSPAGRRTDSPSTAHAAGPPVAASSSSTKEDIIEENKVESAEMVNPRAMRKVIAVVLLPFVGLIFINGIVFALKFVLVTAFFYFLSVGYFVSEITIRPPWYHHHPGARQLTAKGCPEYWEGRIRNPLHDYGIPYEDVTIQSSDGYQLSAWYVPAPIRTGVPVRNLCVVLVHGGGRDRRAWLRHLPMFHEQGYSALLFDFREHGLSSGNCNGFTYGMKERFDVVAAAKYAKDVRGHKKVVAIGTSVGASSVIMATALDATTIDGVVAENAITTCAMLQDYLIMNLFGGYFSRHWISVYVFNAFRLTCSAWLNVRVGNKPSKHCQALHCVQKIAPRPILLMHGDSDEVVPQSHSEQLYRAAASPKELWICDGAFHCGLYNRKPDEFEKRVFRLLQQVEGAA